MTPAPLTFKYLCSANIMWGQVDAVEAARERGLISSLLEALKYQNPEVMNDEQFSALQDAACGALLNMWYGSGLFGLLSIACVPPLASRYSEVRKTKTKGAKWSDLTWVRTNRLLTCRHDSIAKEGEGQRCVAELIGKDGTEPLKAAMDEV